MSVVGHSRAVLFAAPHVGGALPVLPVVPRPGAPPELHGLLLPGNAAQSAERVVQEEKGDEHVYQEQEEDEQADQEQEDEQAHQEQEEKGGADKEAGEKEEHQKIAGGEGDVDGCSAMVIGRRVFFFSGERTVRAKPAMSVYHNVSQLKMKRV